MIRWYDKKLWGRLILLLMVGLAVVTLTSCKTKYVSVPEYHTQYIVRTDTVAKVDSVILQDSVFVYHNGDTVFINKVVYRDRVRNVYKVRTDTICKSDSVLVPYKEEKELSTAEKWYVAIGKVTVWLPFVLLLLRLAWLTWGTTKEIDKKKKQG